MIEQASEPHSTNTAMAKLLALVGREGTGISWTAFFERNTDQLRSGVEGTLRQLLEAK